MTIPPGGPSGFRLMPGPWWSTAAAYVAGSWRARSKSACRTPSAADFSARMGAHVRAYGCVYARVARLCVCVHARLIYSYCYYY